MLKIISTPHPPLSAPSFCLPHFKASAHHIFMFLPHLSFDVTHSHLQRLAAVPHAITPSLLAARLTRQRLPGLMSVTTSKWLFSASFFICLRHAEPRAHPPPTLLTTNGCSDVLSSRECVRVSRFCWGRRSYLSRELQMDMLCSCDSVDQQHLSWREQRICL